MFTKQHFTDFHPEPKTATKGGSSPEIFPAQTLNAKRRLPGVTDLEPLTGPRLARTAVLTATK